ncbi:FAD-dependent oxidoreductase [Candidatus Giovannonibacteria bacterium]|nr:FAD-dependent oxidoreductase [Candidatus Giovannonibacteria bacterium]
MLYDLIIIGGGPAGVAAGVYAGRKRLKTLLVTDAFGGQSLVSNEIQNWIGTKTISGFELAQKMEEHLRAQETVEIKIPERIKAVELREKNFLIQTEKGEAYETKALIVTAGAKRKRLGVPGEDKFEGRGVVYCSTCDAPLFGDKTVAVVGGGNAALEAVVDLLPYAKKVYLLVRGEKLKGDQITQEKVERAEKVEVMFNTEIAEVKGSNFLDTAVIKNRKTEEMRELPVEGVFVEIGSEPNSEILKSLVELNHFGEVVVDHRTGKTSRSGIFAAGDITDELYKQNNISAGDGVAAALSAYNYLLEREHQSPASEKLNGNGS